MIIYVSCSVRGKVPKGEGRQSREKGKGRQRRGKGKGEGRKHVKKGSLTINVPLIWKVREIIFFLRAKLIMGQFKGFFEGAETFLTPKLS
jgi:hypothetical protein